jgi:hypothetical protein
MFAFCAAAAVVAVALGAPVAIAASEPADRVSGLGDQSIARGIEMLSELDAGSVGDGLVYLRSPAVPIDTDARGANLTPAAGAMIATGIAGRQRSASAGDGRGEGNESTAAGESAEPAALRFSPQGLIPIPEAGLLLVSALIGILAFSRRRENLV